MILIIVLYTLVACDYDEICIQSFDTTKIASRYISPFFHMQTMGILQLAIMIEHETLENDVLFETFPYFDKLPSVK